MLYTCTHWISWDVPVSFFLDGTLCFFLIFGGGAPVLACTHVRICMCAQPLRLWLDVAHLSFIRGQHHWRCSSSSCLQALSSHYSPLDMSPAVHCNLCNKCYTLGMMPGPRPDIRCVQYLPKLHHKVPIEFLVPSGASEVID